MIVKWENNVWPLKVIKLHHWCFRIQQLLALFHDLDNMKIYREHKQATYTLSKEALTIEFGLLIWEEYIEGSLVDKVSVTFLDYVDVIT